MFLILIAWVSCGIPLYAFSIYDKGEFIVEDIGMFFPFALIGPFGLLALIWEFIEPKWERLMKFKIWEKSYEREN